jgi:hypothetical protein
MTAQSLAALLLLTVIRPDLAYDPTVRGALWTLLKDAHYGFAASEEAMFIVRDGAGVLSFVRWMATGSPRHAEWSGPVPAGVIAIVHTHPNAMPRPSAADVHTSLRTRLPVYVVTRERVTKTAAGATTVLWKGAWGADLE